MTITIIYRKVEWEQVDSARAVAFVRDAGIRASGAGGYDDLADGIATFIDCVGTLFAGGPNYNDELDAYRMNIGGEEAWVCLYGDGIGDGPDWTANAAWYETEVPGLMDALGVYLEVSGDVYNSPGSYPHRVPEVSR
jgi:hypothetical protein